MLLDEPLPLGSMPLLEQATNALSETIEILMDGEKKECRDTMRRERGVDEWVKNRASTFCPWKSGKYCIGRADHGRFEVK